MFLDWGSNARADRTCIESGSEGFERRSTTPWGTLAEGELFHEGRSVQRGSCEAFARKLTPLGRTKTLAGTACTQIVLVGFGTCSDLPASADRGTGKHSQLCNRSPRNRIEHEQS